MNNYFQASPNNPYHLSVCAIVYNDEQKLMFHRYKKIGRLENVYIPMKETLEPNESIEQCLNRGLLEEYGATVFPEIQFLGSYVVNDFWFGEINRECNVEKTLLCFLVKLREHDDAKRDGSSFEGRSEMVYEDIDFLIQETKSACEKYGVKELDFSSILIRAKEIMKSNLNI